MRAMKHALGPRKEIGIRTIFNLLGPLTNPASAKAQVMGVYDEALVEPHGRVLKNLGVERALVVHGVGRPGRGLDLRAYVRLRGDRRRTIRPYMLTPQDIGLSRRPRYPTSAGGDAKANAGMTRQTY